MAQLRGKTASGGGAAFLRCKSGLVVLAGIAAASIACGRGVFSSSSSSGGGGGGGSTTVRSVYVSNFADGKISALNNSGGTLAKPASILAGSVKGPIGMALAPIATSSPLALLVANSADKKIHEFALDTNGNLKGLASIAAGSGVSQIVVTPSGSFAYAINNGGSISEYLVDPASGKLSANSSASTASGLTNPISAAAIDLTSGSFLYVTDTSGGSGVVLIFTLAANGALINGPGVIASGGPRPAQILIDSVTSGSAWVFVADATTGLISVFQVQTSGALSLFSTIGSGAGAAGMAFASTPSGGAFLYVANPTLGSVASFSFNTVTGLLSALAVTPGFSSPNGLAVDNVLLNSATTLFVANQNAGTISSLSIDSATGLLATIGSSPFPTENPPNAGGSPRFVVVRQ